MPRRAPASVAGATATRDRSGRLPPGPWGRTRQRLPRPTTARRGSWSMPAGRTTYRGSRRPCGPCWVPSGSPLRSSSPTPTRTMPGRLASSPGPGAARSPTTSRRAPACHRRLRGDGAVRRAAGPMADPAPHARHRRSSTGAESSSASKLSPAWGEALGTRGRHPGHRWLGVDPHAGPHARARRARRRTGDRVVLSGDDGLSPGRQRLGGAAAAAAGPVRATLVHDLGSAGLDRLDRRDRRSSSRASWRPVTACRWPGPGRPRLSTSSPSGRKRRREITS